MTSLNNIDSTRRILRHLMRVVDATYRSMGRAVHGARHTARADRAAGSLAEALTFLAQAREGGIISQRTPLGVSSSELQALIEQVLVDWSWLEALGLSRQVEPSILSAEEPLVAYEHSLLALGFIPRLPPEAVTYPGFRRTYADIPIPTTHGSILERFEEMERALAQVELAEDSLPLSEATRRTYGFFEATHWLMRNYLRPLL